MDKGSQSSLQSSLQLFENSPKDLSNNDVSAVVPRQQQRLQNKATAVAIALGTLPVLLIGTAAYMVASRSIGRQIIQEQVQRTEIIGDKLNNFLISRLREVELLAVHPILTESALRTASSPTQQQLILSDFASTLGYFDSVILFDPAGVPIAQATTGKPFLGNYGDRPYFQTALETGRPTMNGPGLSESSGKLRVEFAVPVKDAATDEIIYIIRARIPGNYMNKLLAIFETRDSAWYLLNADGILFASSKKEYLAEPVESYYPSFMELTETERTRAEIFVNIREDNKQQLVSYAPVMLSNNLTTELMTELTTEPMGAMITVDTAIALAPQYHLLRIFALGTGLAAVVIGAVAACVANLAIRPIQHLTLVAQQVTQHSNFDLRAAVQTNDEVGMLAVSLNQLISWVGEHTQELERSQETLEQRVQERTQQLNAIIDNLGDGLLVIDPAGVIIRINPTLVNLFNLQGQTVVGQPCHAIFDRDLSELIAQNQMNTQLLITDVTLPGNGIGQALVTTVAEDNDETDENFGSIVLIRDITTEKEVDQMKTDFISTVSHELRTPLTSVIGFAKLIQKKLEDTVLPTVKADTKKTQRAVRQVRENLSIIVSEGERLTSLINDVLDISKIEAGKIDWNMQPVVISELIERAISATSVLVSNSGLEIFRDIEPGLPEVICDRNRLLQVFINLLSNAIKFTTSGSVTCRAYRQPNEIRVSIIDTGIGLSNDDLDKVFEKFEQVGKVMTDKPRGTGLGLPICKQIIEHHGGRIWAESEPGQGSTFSFTLPLTNLSDIDTSQFNLQTLMRQLKENVECTVIPTANKSQKTILVVDDEPHIRQLLRQELEAAGYDVQVATDGMDALTQIKSAPPDLIILDVMMPKINGFDLAAVLKNNPATMAIPTIVVSIIQDEERGYRLGVDRYFSKPIDTDALLRDIKILLDQGTSNRKVLVVDIDTSTTKTLTEVLFSKGYTVTESSTGKDGIEKALALKPDMIIVDSAISMEHDVVKTLRFDNGLENIFIIMLDHSVSDPMGERVSEGE